MNTPESQDDINRAECENPNNWAGWPFAVYFSKRDSRVWVPLNPKNRFSAKTINFGHHWGSAVATLIFWLFLGIATTNVWMFCHKG